MLRKGIWIGLLLLVFSSCSLGMSKEKYIASYKRFIGEVKENYQTYSTSDWIKADKKFAKYSGRLYKKFERKFTVEDKIVLAKYRLQYDRYRYEEEVKETFGDVVDAITDSASNLINSTKGLLDNLNSDSDDYDED